MSFKEELGNLLASAGCPELAFAREMYQADDEDLAAVVALQDAPQLIDPSFVDSMERYFKGSGRYGEEDALSAIDDYRSTRVAVS